MLFQTSEKSLRDLLHDAPGKGDDFVFSIRDIFCFEVSAH